MLLKNMKLLCAAMLAAGAMALNAAVPAMSLEYFYDKDGTIIGRSVNGEKFTYSYDKKGQLLSVKSLDGKVAEAYAYDPAGNILSKTIDGKTTYFKYDKANQLVSSTDAKGKVTNYEYDAAGRLVKEGDKEYKYSYLDKIVAVTEQGSTVATFDYYVDGQVASTTQGGMQETFVWDGLALIQRNSTNYINEPAITGGNPILADNKVLFNDMLGTTLGAKDGKGNVSLVAMTAFGESKGSSGSNEDAFFTGKPYIGELGHAFLFRNYRADLGKWQTADPMGYPDGWNQLAYVNNGVIDAIDSEGLCTYLLGVCLSRCDVKKISDSIILTSENTIVELTVGCSSGSGAEYKSSSSINVAVNGNISLWGLTIPVNISWSWTPPECKVSAYVCSSTTHVANGGEKSVQFFANTKAKVRVTQYNCGEVSYEVLDKWVNLGNRVTTLTNCPE